MGEDFCVVVCLGPGPKELSRFQDLVASIECFERRHCAAVVVVDDGQQGANALKCLASSINVEVLQNPRAGRGWAWTGGLITGLLVAYRHIWATHDVRYVLKLDTDSLIISSFHDSILQTFAADPAVGMVGSHLQAGRGPREWIPLWLGRKVAKMMRPLSLWRLPTVHLRSSWLPPARKLKPFFEAAVRSGYRLGEVCEGGGYAVGMNAFQRFHEEGLFSQPLSWLHMHLPEDAVFSLLVRACGLELRNLGAPGDCFCIEPKGLRDSPEVLQADGSSIIHSLKDFEDFREEELRGFFREHRLASLSLRQ